MTEREVLVQAREKIAGGWCQGGWCQPRADRFEAESYCAISALLSARAGSIAAPRARLLRLTGVDQLILWNDAPERTQRDVLDLLDVAIAEVDFEAESATERTLGAALDSPDIAMPAGFPRKRDAVAYAETLDWDEIEKRIEAAA